jgi:hypothetical protein
MNRRGRLRAAGVGFALILAACSLTDPEGDDLTVSGEAPAAADAVFQKAEAWLGRGTYQVLERSSPTLIRARRALPGQDRTGRLDFTTSAGAAGTTKYQIVVWTEVLGIQSRQNDAETQADAASLSAALTCPAAKWPSCP